PDPESTPMGKEPARRSLCRGAFRQYPIRARKMACIAVGDTLKIILMLWLGSPEIADRFQFGHDLAGPQARGIHIGYRAQRDLFLRFVHVINGRAIAGAKVVALPVGRGRIVDLEKIFQNPAVTDHLGIECDFDPLGMGTMIAIGSVRHIAAGIAHAGRNDAGQLPDQILHAPETSSGQYCTFRHSALLYLVQILAIPFGFHAVFGNETQRGRIDAIAQPTRFGRAIGKYMSQITVAMSATNLGP